MKIYLDNNASTPIAPEVLAACQEELQLLGNPSSTHSAGQEAKLRLTKARRTVSSALNVSPSEILFTSSGTEAMNLLIRGVLGKRRHKGRIITSPTEHACVFAQMPELEAQGYEIIMLKPGLTGQITAKDVAEVLDEETALVTLMAANNETGVLNDWQEISKLTAQNGTPFVVDGVALLGKEPFTIPEGVTGMGFSGHKVHAPKGIGFTYLKRGTKIAPQLIGGSQEANLRGGTENLVGIAGLACGVSLLTDIDSHAKNLKSLRDHFEKRLLKELSDVEINGKAVRVSNTSNLAFIGCDGESLLMSLDLEGIFASHGSACSSGSLEPSRILQEMGYPRSHVRSSLRFSFSRYNTLDEINQAIDHIIRNVQRLRAI